MKNKIVNKPCFTSNTDIIKTTNCNSLCYAKVEYKIYKQINNITVSIYLFILNI